VLTVAVVREMVLTRWPGRFAPEMLGDDVPLGEDGLGLDSIELVELALACEERGTGEVDEELLRRQPLTIRHLAAHFGGARWTG
jgi:acyl carrier protein